MQSYELMNHAPRTRLVPLSPWEQQMLRAPRTNDNEQRRRPRVGLAPDVLWEAQEARAFLGWKHGHASVMEHLRERVRLP